MRKYYEQPNANKFNNLNEMGKFLESTDYKICLKKKQIT